MFDKIVKTMSLGPGFHGQLKITIRYLFSRYMYYIHVLVSCVLAGMVIGKTCYFISSDMS